MKKYIYPVILLLVVVVYYLFTGENLLHTDKDVPETTKTVSEYKGTNANLQPKSTHEVVHHAYYSLGYSETHEQAAWTMHVVGKEDIQYKEYKRPFFENDTKVSTKSAHWRNYKNSGLDKGHLVPAGDRRASKTEFNATFLTSNVSPQPHKFNAGIWNNLEKFVRREVKKYNDITVFTGPILNNKLPKIGQDQVSVPKQFYKIMVRKTKNGYKTMTFLMPTHADKREDIFNYLTSIDAVEALTDIDFLAQLPKAEQRNIETLNSRW